MKGPSPGRIAVAPFQALCVVLSAALAASCGGPEEPPARHVLLITLDTTRADSLGCYGSARNETPALDALAAEGVRFRDCTSAAATTLSSHTSLFTGTYPNRHGVVRNGFVVDESNVMLAETLREAGFWCAAFIGSSALVERSGLSQGFHVYDDAFDVAAEAGGPDQDQRIAATVTDAVLSHVDEVLARDGGGEQNLFLFAHYFDPHAPYAPPADISAELGASMPVADFDDIEAAVRAQQKRVLGQDLGQQQVITRGLPKPLAQPFPSYPTARDSELARLYTAEVTYTDREVGRLLVGLRSRGLLEDTLVIVTADHGETFWEHGNFWNHGLWVSQTDVHVPLLFRMPRGEAAGVEVRVPVSGVDVAPTVLDVLGLWEGDRKDPGVGRSLLPAILGREFGDRAVFTEATQPGPFLEKGVTAGEWRGAGKPHAVRLGPWKLVRAPYLGLTQLFRLDRDPDENVDLLAKGAVVGEARERLTDLEIALGRWMRAAKPRPSEFDVTQVKALVGLGYGEAAPSSSRAPSSSEDGPERKDADPRDH